MSRLTPSEAEKGFRAAPNRKYNHNTSYCGTPEDMYVRVSGTSKKVCLSCNVLSTRNRECTKCGKIFTPGCKIRFVCLACFKSNILKASES